MAVAGIVAGGSGQRMGGSMPKQFMELCGKPVIIRTIEAFLQHADIESVIIGINPDWYDYMSALVQKDFRNGVYITKGGKDRNDTILNIIKYARNTLHCNDNEIILTHDAVRPFVTEKMISDSIAEMDRCEICTAAIAAVDTIVVSEDGENVCEFPPRNTMYQVQTPQTFRIGSFSEVYGNLTENEKKTVTDACKLFSLNGYRVRLIDGDRNNIKLTYPSDFFLAEAIVGKSGS